MKYLPCANLEEARSKSHAALEKKYPNRRLLQLAKHNANPRKYPHPDTMDYWEYDTEHFILEDPDTGTVEIEIPPLETDLYPGEQSNMRNESAVLHARGPNP